MPVFLDIGYHLKQSAHIENRYIVYDDRFLSEQECYGLFDDHRSLLATQQRGTAIFIDHGDHQLVAKHYQRGGLLRHINKDQYFACSAEQSRALKEWDLLYQLRAMDLPVPSPIALHLELNTCFYRADLVTERLAAEPLSQYLINNDMRPFAWYQLGKTIKHFHQYSVYHDDLNASNILVDSQMQFSIIDFDKACIKPGVTWKVDNLLRLRRSLIKYKAKSPDFHFTDENWQQLMAAYRDS